MSHVHAGPLASYNSLLDPSLQSYFGNPQMRKHLRKAGLVGKTGKIVPEEKIRANVAKKVYTEHVKNLLSQEIIYKVLDIERTRQVAIRNELERTAKKELVKRVRSDLSRKGDEDILPFLTPRPSTAPAGRGVGWGTRRTRRAPSTCPVSSQSYTQTPGHSVQSSTSSMSTVASRQKSMSKATTGRRGRSRKKPISVVDFQHAEIDDKHLYALDQQALWKITMGELAMGLSPYLLPLPSPRPVRPTTGHPCPARGRRNQPIMHPTNSCKKSTKLQNCKRSKSKSKSHTNE
ncbi:hypothetical protein LSAT2_016382 [Lamellibrachia satsuma]|nr:hypothetical protein LSAT2_016382 [Lamellibrachia satsuma]